MLRKLGKAALLFAAVVLWSSGAAHANLIISPAPNPAATPPGTGTFTAEAGGSIPAGTGGFVDGNLLSNASTTLIFTYGPFGGTGHGDSTNINEFWVGPNRAAAEAAGHFFCTGVLAGSPCLVSSVSGVSSFAVGEPLGQVPFCFSYHLQDVPGGHTLCNNQVDNTNGAYLAQIGLGVPPNAGPGPIAYLGLSDNPFPADNDFQDLTVQVRVPEPATLLLLGFGLVGLGAAGWRRKPR